MTIESENIKPENIEKENSELEAVGRYHYLQFQMFFLIALILLLGGFNIWLWLTPRMSVEEFKAKLDRKQEMSRDLRTALNDLELMIPRLVPEDSREFRRLNPRREPRDEIQKKQIRKVPAKRKIQPEKNVKVQPRVKQIKELGLPEAPSHVSLSWISARDFQKLIAAKWTRDQPALQNKTFQMASGKMNLDPGEKEAEAERDQRYQQAVGRLTGNTEDQVTPEESQSEGSGHETAQDEKTDRLAGGEVSLKDGEDDKTGEKAIQAEKQTGELMQDVKSATPDGEKTLGATKSDSEARGTKTLTDPGDGETEGSSDRESEFVTRDQPENPDNSGKVGGVPITDDLRQGGAQEGTLVDPLNLTFPDNMRGKIKLPEEGEEGLGGLSGIGGEPERYGTKDPGAGHQEAEGGGDSKQPNQPKQQPESTDTDLVQIRREKPSPELNVTSSRKHLNGQIKRVLDDLDQFVVELKQRERRAKGQGTTPALPADRESIPRSRVVMGVHRLGGVVVGKGMEIKTFMPRLDPVMRLTAPYNPTVAIMFDGYGKVVYARFVQGTRSGSWDAPILKSVYKFRARGPQLIPGEYVQVLITFDLGW